MFRVLTVGTQDLYLWVPQCINEHILCFWCTLWLTSLDSNLI